jgi:hypothetical protein
MIPAARDALTKRTPPGPLNRTITNTVLTKISGTYQRQDGGRRFYSYEGSFGVNSEGTWYIVTVRSGGRVKGTPMGVLVEELAPEIDHLRTLIGRQIERLDQVTE